MIAFAGFLLEYPVSYYPVASVQGSFLCGTPLEVYECILIPCGLGLPGFVPWEFHYMLSNMNYLVHNVDTHS